MLIRLCNGLKESKKGVIKFILSHNVIKHKLKNIAPNSF